jgi:sortase A
MWKSSKSGAKPKRRWQDWIWLERFLLVLGLSLLIVYGAVRIDGILGSRAALKKFATRSFATSVSQNAVEDVAAPQEEVSTQEMERPDVDFSLWDVGRVDGYKQIPAEPSGTPLAVLRIPKIRLEVPVLEGTDNLTLNRGAGRIAGTARPGEQGNIGIAGHRDGFFRGLKNVGVGDAIELKTLRGTDRYVVDRVQIVTPHDVQVLRPRSVPSLTLVTCYPFYFFGSAPQRYIVTASLSHER